MSHRDFKDTLYAQFARIGHAVSSPKRLEMLDLLSQGEKTVEQLAAQSETPIKNTSAHLRALRQARLVDTRRDGTYVYYRVGDETVIRLLQSLQELGRVRLAEVELVASLYLVSRDELDAVGLKDLRRLVRAGAVTLIDVRPRDEFEAGHIPGAISLPVPELRKRLGEIPKAREVIAYCRGPYCVYSLEAVTLLRKHGYRARRAEQGLPEWRTKGFDVVAGA
jgi:rhodanese-related sulfurtransferase